MFDNHVPGVIDAPVNLGGTPVRITDGVLGWRWEAQLFGGPEGMGSNALMPLFPKTTFQTGASAGYVVPVVVTIPDVPPGGKAVLQMRAFNDTSSTFEGRSKVFAVIVGGGALPPANLVGSPSSSYGDFSAFSVSFPEPSVIVLIALGLGLFIVRSRK